MMTVVSPSVCLSVCHVPDPNLERKGYKLKIGRKEPMARMTRDPI